MKEKMNRNAVISLFLFFIVSTAFSQKDNNSVINDITYGEALNDMGVSQSLLLDFYTSEKQVKKNLPAIILVHGGGFGAGDKQQDLYVKMANEFVENGYVAFSINYRLKTKSGLNNAVADALAALKWVKQHSSEYGVDTTKIIIAGDSAGGATAVNAAFRYPERSKFVACIDLWGGQCNISSSTPTYKHDHGWDQPIYPLPISSDVPPTCIIHGTKDSTVPLLTSKNLSEELNSVGVYNELHILEGAKHYPETLANQFIPIMIDFANKAISEKGFLTAKTKKSNKNIPEIKIEGLSELPGAAYFNMEIIQKTAEKVCDLGTATVVFPQGIFYVSSKQAEQDFEDVLTEKIPQRTNPEHTNCLMDFDSVTNLTIDGQGCKLLFRGLVQPFDFEDCKNVEVKNLSFDWDRPMFSEGRVTMVKQNMLEVEVFREYPVKGGEPILSFQTYSPKTGHLTGVCSFTNISSCELIGKQLVRFVSGDSRLVKEGDIIILRHKYNYKPGFNIFNCEDVTLRNVTINALPGMGLYGVRTKNITLKHYNVRPSGNRIMSANVDATHFYSCTGVIELDSCYFEGMGDNATNVHGYYHTVLEKMDDRTVKTCITHSMEPNVRRRDYPDTGDKVEFVKGNTLNAFGCATIVSADFNQETRETIVKFDRPIPKDFEMDDLIANLSKLSKLKFTNNVVRDIRGRGILVQTRGALIENNSFEYCTGQGIHIDTAWPWMESIGTRNIVIRNNRFINCAYGFTNYRDALAVCVETETTESVIGIHRGITIEDNFVIGHTKPAFYSVALIMPCLKGTLF